MRELKLFYLTMSVGNRTQGATDWCLRGDINARGGGGAFRICILGTAQSSTVG